MKSRNRSCAVCRICNRRGAVCRLCNRSPANAFFAFFLIPIIKNGKSTGAEAGAFLYSGTSGCISKKQYHTKIRVKKRLYTYTYTYTQMKLRIYDIFMHFSPIFRIIHIHIHIHTNEISHLRCFHAFQADFLHYTHTHTHTHKNIALNFSLK